MGRKAWMGKRVKLSEIPQGKTIDDYPEDTLFVLDEGDEDDWSDVEDDED